MLSIYDGTNYRVQAGCSEFCNGVTSALWLGNTVTCCSNNLCNNVKINNTLNNTLQCYTGSGSNTQICNSNQACYVSII